MLQMSVKGTGRWSFVIDGGLVMYWKTQKCMLLSAWLYWVFKEIWRSLSMLLESDIESERFPFVHERQRDG